MMIMVACKAFGINQGQKVYFIVFSIAIIFYLEEFLRINGIKKYSSHL